MTRHGLFTKDQLGKLYGISANTIDLYVARDLLHPIYLQDGVFFTGSDFVRIEIIQKGMRLGFSLDEVRELIATTQKQKAN